MADNTHVPTAGPAPPDASSAPVLPIPTSPPAPPPPDAPSPAPLPDDADAELRIVYGYLSIIDSKASALLTFNAIGLAAISLWLGYVPLNLLHNTLDLVFILLLVSCLLCLCCVPLYWDDDDRLTDHVDKQTLRDKKDRRTRCYRLARRVSLASVLLLIAVSSLHMIDAYWQGITHRGYVSDRLFRWDEWRNLDYRE